MSIAVERGRQFVNECRTVGRSAMVQINEYLADVSDVASLVIKEGADLTDEIGKRGQAVAKTIGTVTPQTGYTATALKPYGLESPIAGDPINTVTTLTRLIKSTPYPDTKVVAVLETAYGLTHLNWSGAVEFIQDVRADHLTHRSDGKPAQLTDQALDGKKSGAATKTYARIQRVFNHGLLPRDIFEMIPAESKPESTDSILHPDVLRFNRSQSGLNTDNFGSLVPTLPADILAIAAGIVSQDATPLFAAISTFVSGKASDKGVQVRKMAKSPEARIAGGPALGIIGVALLGVSAYLNSKGLHDALNSSDLLPVGIQLLAHSAGVVNTIRQLYRNHARKLPRTDSDDLRSIFEQSREMQPTHVKLHEMAPLFADMRYRSVAQALLQQSGAKNFGIDPNDVVPSDKLSNLPKVDDWTRCDRYLFSESRRSLMIDNNRTLSTKNPLGLEIALGIHRSHISPATKEPSVSDIPDPIFWDLLRTQASDMRLGMVKKHSTTHPDVAHRLVVPELILHALTENRSPTDAKRSAQSQYFNGTGQNGIVEGVNAGHFESLSDVLASAMTSGPTAIKTILEHGLRANETIRRLDGVGRLPLHVELFDILLMLSRADISFSQVNGADAHGVGAITADFGNDNPDSSLRAYESIVMLSSLGHFADLLNDQYIETYLLQLDDEHRIQNPFPIAKKAINEILQRCIGIHLNKRGRTDHKKLVQNDGLKGYSFWAPILGMLEHADIKSAKTISGYLQSLETFVTNTYVESEADYSWSLITSLGDAEKILASQTISHPMRNVIGTVHLKTLASIGIDISGSRLIPTSPQDAKIIENLPDSLSKIKSCIDSLVESRPIPDRVTLVTTIVDNIVRASQSHRQTLTSMEARKNGSPKSISQFQRKISMIQTSLPEKNNDYRAIKCTLQEELCALNSILSRNTVNIAS